MRAFPRTALLAVAALLPALAADEFSTSAGPVKITPIRHASLMIEAGGQVIHIDPWSQGNYEGLPKADLILVTDTHGDHLDMKVLPRLRKDSTTVIAAPAAAAQIPGAKPLKNGESTTWGNWRIDAIAAYNITRGPESGKVFHEKGRGNGYVLTYGGKRFYIAGDTEVTPEMKALKSIEVAFLPMNLPYTMTPEEAAEGARALNPKVVYPYHYRGSDLAAFESALKGTGIEVRRGNWY